MRDRREYETQINFKIDPQTLSQFGDFRWYTKLDEINEGNHAHNVGHDVKHREVLPQGSEEKP